MSGKLKSNQAKTLNLIYIMNGIEHGLGRGVKNFRGEKIGAVYVKNVKIYPPPSIKSLYTPPVLTYVCMEEKIHVVYYGKFVLTL